MEKMYDEGKSGSPNGEASFPETSFGTFDSSQISGSTLDQKASANNDVPQDELMTSLADLQAQIEQQIQAAEGGGETSDPASKSVPVVQGAEDGIVSEEEELAKELAKQQAELEAQLREAEKGFGEGMQTEQVPAHGDSKSMPAPAPTQPLGLSDGTEGLGENELDKIQQDLQAQLERAQKELENQMGDLESPMDDSKTLQGSSQNMPMESNVNYGKTFQQQQPSQNYSSGPASNNYAYQAQANPSSSGNYPNHVGNTGLHRNQQMGGGESLYGGQNVQGGMQQNYQGSYQQQQQQQQQQHQPQYSQPHQQSVQYLPQNQDRNQPLQQGQYQYQHQAYQQQQPYQQQSYQQPQYQQQQYQQPQYQQPQYQQQQMQSNNGNIMNTQTSNQMARNVQAPALYQQQPSNMMGHVQSQSQGSLQQGPSTFHPVPQMQQIGGASGSTIAHSQGAPGPQASNAASIAPSNDEDESARLEAQIAALQAELSQEMQSSGIDQSMLDGSGTN
eukprot:CAMPEP_0184490134 /NCGR_PEP_ID=MMETSP0113_2-20130426/17197_1 /TAXON_ID=91329 /ORGANISM="Norrisiella sphaerica, Strain BC52" /LENGTH=502 /DNA_ID=CAMNT_0026873893 /DNA_START=707 /DNA_END=2215 /DNA_ORIENTATION=+